MILIAALLIGAAVAYYNLRSSSSSQPREVEAASKASPEPPVAVSSDERTSPAAPVRKTASSLGSHSAAAQSGQASAPPQDLITRLAQFDPAQGVMTPERAAQLKQDLRDLAAQGTNALPAIRQFLEGNQDINWDDPNGHSLAGFASMRASLLDVVHQIGGPEATETFLHTLTSTAEPAEIALVAKYLEEQAPGEYRQNVIAAARESVDQFAKGQLQTHEIGPLFQVMQTYGDASVLPDLQTALAQWPTYGIMALAGLPEGQGVSALVDRLKDSSTEGLPPTQRAFAYQMLAQNSAQSPLAANALLEQARQGQVPEAAWPKIAEGLSGPQYQITVPVFADSSPKTLAMISGMTTYRLEQGNQNYYSLAFDPAAAPAETAQRRAVVEQLLAVAANNPAAVDALQRARQKLTRF
ncbi:MAG: hypothetical protein U1G07_13420 [Verrucomicrobiota bacterium]